MINQLEDEDIQLSFSLLQILTCFLKKIQSKYDDRSIYTLDVLAIVYIDIVFKQIRKLASPASTTTMAVFLLSWANGEIQATIKITRINILCIFI